ncbi:5-formyltetrahydrofolate cyclo-ligase [Roseibium sediminicola]|uniref:5-formyltetrahydrofolate cyclo-ligase n=1 Tax=Roseibium sediminicola TaxID=2933272 RepID=A0ABT0GQC1_9HYPH|nr:5-formyltetrahydrofolate cyclo-ligase [Roseibium sp. CAU 1639]MCK7611641.1 5-formyltetrahydrofolate cyclo-ligase [Roseibium sp. CAU 1639]
MHEDDDPPGDPACHAHKIIGGHLIDEQTYLDVRQFRKSERERLYQKRRQQGQSDRQTATSALIARLREVLTDRQFETIAVYWPIRGEPDLRPLMTELYGAGKKVLLPVVLERKAPLIFRPWSPGCEMIRGTWNILVPANGPPQHPQIVIAPVVGIDKDLYRLGNGGGYYDRTLASMNAKPLVVGVGFAFSQIETIFPMAWDLPMDMAILA